MADLIPATPSKSSSSETDLALTDDAAHVRGFAHRLSADVTHDAVLLATQNGAFSTLPTSGCELSGSHINLGPSNSCRYASFDHIHGASKQRENSEVPKRKTSGKKIRDVSRTFTKWLRIKSTSSEPNRSWRLWRKPSENRQDPSKRALPPVPTPVAAASPIELEDDHHSDYPLGVEGLRPGEAFIPDDDDDEVRCNSSSPSSTIDFAASIEKVINYGWYWGPLSGEAAERLLRTEADGSFVVRDSSDDHYIFSLTFKLDGKVRHVRIEHDHGNFSFGSSTKFKSHTIVDFIENAVEHSRSGRYLFFIQRRPVQNGPMRVQLLHPVSRFKQIQSLQHLCRFVILKLVPRDLLHELPVPKRVCDYLNTPHYYCESVAELTTSAGNEVNRGPQDGQWLKSDVTQSTF